MYGVYFDILSKDGASHMNASDPPYQMAGETKEMATYVPEPPYRMTGRSKKIETMVCMHFWPLTFFGPLTFF
jgi:hypothetical protein